MDRCRRRARTRQRLVDHAKTGSFQHVRYRTGRSDEYGAIVAQLKRERIEFLGGFEQLGDEIVDAVR